MATFFGQYLLERGVITRDKLLEAIASYKSRFDSFPNFLVAQGKLSRERADAFLDEVLRTGASFFDLMAKYGDFSIEQSNELRRKYFRENGIGAALLQCGALTTEALDQEYASYVKNSDQLAPWLGLGYLQAQLEQDVLGDEESRSDGEEVNAGFYTLLFGQTAQMLFFLTGLESHLGGVETGCQAVSASALDVSIDFEGDIEGMFRLRFPRTVIDEIVRRLPGTYGQTDANTTVDSLKELLNIIAGTVCAALDNDELEMQISPPSYELPAPALQITSGKHATRCAIYVPIADDPIETVFVR